MFDNLGDKHEISDQACKRLDALHFGESDSEGEVHGLDQAQQEARTNHSIEIAKRTIENANIEMMNEFLTKLCALSKPEERNPEPQEEKTEEITLRANDTETHE